MKLRSRRCKFKSAVQNSKIRLKWWFLTAKLLNSWLWVAKFSALLWVLTKISAILDRLYTLRILALHRTSIRASLTWCFRIRKCRDKMEDSRFGSLSSFTMSDLTTVTRRISEAWKQFVRITLEILYELIKDWKNSWNNILLLIKQLKVLQLNSARIRVKIILE